eukprot:Gregarina_sp_Poly_1__10603@NODE_791_length_6269_cov_18_831990_g579_i0_p2_GENE_NODE_791_length_6269_cov_18_831990_g579_i0NODE_791_length_6269_cov_18_831990_g579_i0_p2_ORF_typecomplete_len478_score38_08Mucin/PF01456_17/0_033Mucin/PF01456_17/5_1e02_NODE_791_length_6269_cov_18_831990_g579_i027764209
MRQILIAGFILSYQCYQICWTHFLHMKTFSLDNAADSILRFNLSEFYYIDPHTHVCDYCVSPMQIIFYLLVSTLVSTAELKLEQFEDYDFPFFEIEPGPDLYQQDIAADADDVLSFNDHQSLDYLAQDQTSAEKAFNLREYTHGGLDSSLVPWMNLYGWMPPFVGNPGHWPFTWPYPWQPGWPARTRPPSMTTTTIPRTTAPSTTSETGTTTTGTDVTTSASSTSTTRPSFGGGLSVAEINQLLLQVLNLLTRLPQLQSNAPSSENFMFGSQSRNPTAATQQQRRRQQAQEDNSTTTTTCGPDNSTSPSESTQGSSPNGSPQGTPRGSTQGPASGGTAQGSSESILSGLFPDLTGGIPSISGTDSGGLGSGLLSIAQSASDVLASPRVPWWAQFFGMLGQQRWSALEDFEINGNDPWPFAKIFGSPFSRTVQAMNGGMPILPAPISRLLGNTFPSDFTTSINYDPLSSAGLEAPPFI